MNDKPDAAILPCPNRECGALCEVIRGRRPSVQCTNINCNYMGPDADSRVEAIRLHNLICTPPAGWISVKDHLPEGRHGVPYMTFLTDVVLVKLRDRPNYPLTAHAALSDNLSSRGTAIPTNGASQYKEIAWYSAGRNLSNPFDAASGPDGAFKDSAGYQRFLPSYFGRAITHWMPLPASQENDASRQEGEKVRMLSLDDVPMQLVYAAIDAEQELSDEPPTEMKDWLRSASPDEIVEAMRIAVRQTKDGIRNRLQALIAEAN